MEKIKNWHCLRRHDYYTDETWHSGALGQGPTDIPVWVTFTQSQGHRGWLKIWKNSNVDTFSDTITTTHETWHKGTLYLGLLDPTIFCDLHSRSRSQGLTEILENLRNLFSNTIITTAMKAVIVEICWKAFQHMPLKGDLRSRSHDSIESLGEPIESIGNSVTLAFSWILLSLQSWKLARLYSVERPFRASQHRWPWSKVKVTGKGGKPGKHHYWHFLNHYDDYGQSDYTSLGDLPSRSRSSGPADSQEKCEYLYTISEPFLQHYDLWSHQTWHTSSLMRVLSAYNFSSSFSFPTKTISPGLSHVKFTENRGGDHLSSSGWWSFIYSFQEVQA